MPARRKQAQRYAQILMKLTFYILLFTLSFITTTISAQSLRYPDSDIIKLLHIKSVSAICLWTDSLFQEGSYFWEFDKLGNLTNDYYKYNDSTFSHKSYYSYDSLNLLAEIRTISFGTKDSSITYYQLDYDRNNLLKVKYKINNFNDRTEYFYENGLCILELDIINDGINLTRSIFNSYNSKNQLTKQLHVLTAIIGGPNENRNTDGSLFYKEFTRDGMQYITELQYGIMKTSKKEAESKTLFEYYYTKDGRLEKITERNGEILHQTIIYSYTYY